MADKKDMASLVGLLQDVCLDFRGYRHIAKHCYDKWAYEMKEYREANSSRVSQLFDEVNANLRNEAPEERLLQSLINAVEKAFS
jgi:hypothetical protein